jgi:hypothetical protein
LQNSGEIAPRDRGVMFAVIASEAKQSISPRKKGRMDCFVASLLAMTVSNRISLAMTVPRRAPPLQPSSPAKAGDPVFQRRL